MHFDCIEGYQCPSCSQDAANYLFKGNNKVLSGRGEDRKQRGGRSVWDKLVAFDEEMGTINSFIND